MLIGILVYNLERFATHLVWLRSQFFHQRLGAIPELQCWDTSTFLQFLCLFRHMLKRPSAFVDAEPATKSSETGASAKRPRVLKPSDYCKNAKCAGPNGSRLRKQSGCKGYCRTCASLFVPDVMADVKMKLKDADKKRADKFPCSRCGASYYFKMDPSTHLHFCKACWPQRMSGEPSVIRCGFCFAKGSDVTSRPCSITKGCGNTANMCTTCYTISSNSVCIACW